MIDIQIILITALSVINIFVIGLCLIYFFKYRSVLKAAVQATIDKIALQDHIAKASNQEEPDGFVKFLSESREWAFTYIEEVQLAIKTLKEAMDSDDENRISDAYAELIKYLPESKNN
jgi:biopolymer transport protein ExbB/TolQ